MRVLAINDVSSEGGAGQLFWRTNALLRKYGHDVVALSGETLLGGGAVASAASVVPPPPSSGLKKFVPKSIRSSGGRLLSEWAAVRRAFRHVRYPKLIRRLETATAGQRFDVAHVHNLHNRLSASVLSFVHAQGIPLVFQVNDYFIFCNNYAGFNEALDAPCKLCIHGNAAWAARYGCTSYGNAFGRVVSVIEAGRRFALNAIDPWKNVDLFLVTSEVSRDLMVERGTAKEKIFPVRNPVVASEFGAPGELGTDIIFYGGFLVHKGVETFIRALEEADAGLSFGVYLMGMPESYAHRLRDVAQRRGLRIRIDPRVRWDSGLKTLVARARAVVVPSRWWVTTENVVYEAMCFGKAVIVGRRGGNAELVDDGETGFIFDTDNASDLARHMNRLGADAGLAARLGAQARRRALERFSESIFVGRLEEAYRLAIAEKNKAAHGSVT